MSVANPTFGGGIGVDYSSTELGAGAQLLLTGFDIGVDLSGIVDFIAGLLTIDLCNDDI